MSDLIVSERLRRIIACRETISHDFFGGWVPSDHDLFAGYREQKAGTPGYITDYFGVLTPVDCGPGRRRTMGVPSPIRHCETWRRKFHLLVNR